METMKTRESLCDPPPWLFADERRSDMSRLRRQIHAYVTPDLRKTLRVYAARRNCSESAIVDEAIKRYLDNETDSSLVLRRLDQVNRAMGGMQRSLEVITETVAAFIEIYYAHTPSIAPADKAAARQEAAARFASFMQHVSTKLRAGPSFAVELVKDGALVEDSELGVGIAEPDGAAP